LITKPFKGFIDCLTVAGIDWNIVVACPTNGERKPGRAAAKAATGRSQKQRSHADLHNHYFCRSDGMY